MPKRRKRMGTVDRPEKAIIVTKLPCSKPARKILQFSLRASRPRTTCHDIVVECAGHEGDRLNTLRVRAICTTPKAKEEFIAMAEGYAESVKLMLE
jgi:hypothetical protein